MEEMKNKKDYYTNFDINEELLSDKEKFNKIFPKNSSDSMSYEEKKIKPEIVNGEVVMVPDNDPVDFSDNKQNIKNNEKSNLVIKSENYDIEEDIDIKDLAKAFKIFSGDYLTHIKNFNNMTLEEKKLFIIYSLFRFRMKFDQDSMEGIVSDEVLNEIRKLGMDFVKYGSYTGCSLQLGNSVNGPVLSGVGHNITTPLNTNKTFKNLDSYELIDIINFAKKGYKYTDSSVDQEEFNMNALNHEFNEEFQAFNDLIESLFMKQK